MLVNFKPFSWQQACKWLVDETSVRQVAAVFAAGTLVFGFGLLKLMRLVVDPYAAVSVNLIHIFLTLIAWGVSGGAFAALVLRLKAKQHLSIEDAIIFLAAIAVMGLFVYQTFCLYSEVPRSHRAEERQALINWVRNANSRGSEPVNEYLTFDSSFTKGGILLLRYTAKERDGLVWTRDGLQEQLKAEACGYLATYGRYETVRQILYQFSLPDKKLEAIFNKADCS